MENIRQSKALAKAGSNWPDIRFSELMFCLCLLSIFLPVKIYPLIFLISSFIFYRDSEKLSFPMWLGFLGVYSLYAIISLLMFYDGESQMITNMIKLLVNFTFLYFAVNWLRQRDNVKVLKWVDLTLHLIFLLVLVQLLIYHNGMEFRLIYGSTSSGQASMLYNKDLYYWGLDDKNMFGARIAMLGFPYLLFPLVRWNMISWWRICGIFLLAFLSLSRTPIVALFIGVFFLIWISTGKGWRIALLVLVGLSLPFLLERLIRVENLTASNDGMGIRLVYWQAFFENFPAISPFGIGFTRTPEFLETYAAFYRGEPHIHNTFLHNYLELGIVGFLTYCLFLVFFFLDALKMLPQKLFWLLASLPILSIMMILYTGYDNDIVVYLTLLFMLGSIRFIDFKSLRMSL